jgi:DNA-binding beta-propeller fold protein YncE
MPGLLAGNDHHDTAAAPSLRVEATIPVGPQIGVRSVAVSAGAVWVVSDNDHVLYRIDPAQNRVTDSLDLGQHIEGLLISDGSIWVTGYEPPDLFRVDPKTVRVQARIEMPDYVYGMEAAYGAIWAPAGPAGLVVVNPRTNETSVRDLGTSVGQIVAAGDSLWALALDDGDLLQLDQSGQLVGRHHIGGKLHMSASAGGALWVNDMMVSEVTRVNVTTGRVEARIPVGRTPHLMTAAGDSLLVGNFEDGTMSVIDMTTNLVTTTTPRLGERIGGIGVGNGSIWVALNREKVLQRLTNPGW